MLEMTLLAQLKSFWYNLTYRCDGLGTSIWKGNGKTSTLAVSYTHLSLAVTEKVSVSVIVIMFYVLQENVWYFSG